MTEMLRRSRSKGGGQEANAAVWAALSGTTVGDAWLRRDEPKSAELVARYQEAVAQLARGVPFAYAVRRAGFRTLDLLIDSRALIPRLETEGLVDLVLRHAGSGGLAADIGTGSGCIALALATEGRFERIIAVERSAQAVALARENVARVRPPTPVEIREGDLLAPLAGARYRVIVANPPYLSDAEYDALDPSVKSFEPREALVSGQGGLDATGALLAGAAALLESGGFLALEIDERRGDAVCGLAHAHGWTRIDVHEDIFGRPRFAVAYPTPMEG
jgi:release factor glutamine methyltransferase